MLHAISILEHLASMCLLRLVGRLLEAGNSFLVKPIVKFIIYRRCGVVVVYFSVACCISGCIGGCIGGGISASVRINSGLRIY
jgi:hypothetical protein